MSTPTVSRFEAGDRNIQLASALAILDALGLAARSSLEFPQGVERYDPDRDRVLFQGHTPAGDIDCAITGEALEDSYGARGESARKRLAAFREHRSEIEGEARRKHRAGRLEPDGSILIRSRDIEG